MAGLGDALLAALCATGMQLLWLLGPAAACAIVLSQLEGLTSALLARTFGWRAVLATGWLGVPVHELSHVAACLVFMHEVEEVKLFSPDPESGRLGFVRHRAPAANPWAELGRLFIGLAPLAGGAFALYLVARAALPDAALASLLDAPSTEVPAREALERALWSSVALFDPRHLASWRLWAFLAVATCIGAHLAPSRSDLRGAARGALALVLLAFVVNLAAQPFGGFGEAQLRMVAAWTTPLLALLLLAVVLSSAVLALALVVTSLVEWRRGAEGHLGRFAREHWARLALVAGAGLAFAFAAGALPRPF
ncbi:MAG: hypothetical protein KF729_24575 [Sandaracinaceae bacterium]|nr:hypothetical protein [Sandaracinaceae bacterium]